MNPPPGSRRVVVTVSVLLVLPACSGESPPKAPEPSTQAEAPAAPGKAAKKAPGKQDPGTPDYAEKPGGVPRGR